MFDWNQLLPANRLGSSSAQTDIRSAFQRDYDRIIFSSPFRRLQNKTQVFPLPGSVFVHNRLTHSLEVASVGRSLARTVARDLIKTQAAKDAAILNEIDTIVATACLAHDLGNPPFGHSGEKAISSYFTEGEGNKLKNQIPEHQWSDLVEFEGNANAFRILTHQFEGRRKGGFSLTFATLGSLIKYPYPSSTSHKRKKYGVFHSEKSTFAEVMLACGIEALDDSQLIYPRHPLVYLMEAADDISYLIMDIEDAHKLGILSTEETERLMLSVHNPEIDDVFFTYKEKIFQEVRDVNERIAFLRATAINKLVGAVSQVFLTNYNKIMQGTFQGALVDHLNDWQHKALETCRNESVKRIYQHPAVVKIELTGFNVLGTLMHEFVPAMLEPKKTYHKKLLSLLPDQFKQSEDSPYAKVQSVIDFVSGMTDLYAMQLYKDLRGIDS